MTDEKLNEALELAKRRVAGELFRMTDDEFDNICAALLHYCKWRDIESAPEGEHTVIGLVNGEPLLVNKWHKGAGADAPFIWVRDRQPRFTDNGRVIEDKPTHWLPLPPTPEGD